jgi:hypothetical protein
MLIQAPSPSVQEEIAQCRHKGLQIDHQLALGRRLHRQVGRLLALEDAIDSAARCAIHGILIQRAEWVGPFNGGSRR